MMSGSMGKNGGNSDITVMIASHKMAEVPGDDIYLPVQAGSHGKESIPGFARDDEGDNISSLNNMYSELSVLYWGWHNLQSDNIGLVHYRRYFKGKNGILTGEEAREILGKHKIILPKPRRYYIETLYSHYDHTHQGVDLDTARAVIEDKYPEYLKSYDKTVQRTYGYMFNMMVMPKVLIDSYCTWLFDVLKEVTSRIDSSSRTDFEKRYPGRVSEIIFNCWLDRQIEQGNIKRNDIKELPFLYKGKVNRIAKGTAFLKAKFAGKKHTGSF